MRTYFSAFLGILALASVLCASRAGEGVARAQQTAGESSAAEIAFWNSIKDTADPEELKAYLDAFPNGTFASLARIRLKNLEQERHKSRSEAGRSDAGRKVLVLTEPIVREVQEALYNLNYRITAINGKLIPEVTEAIRSLQSKLGEAVTGELTEAQLAKLRRIDIPKTWGAMAALRKGGFEASWLMPTRREAEAKVLLACTADGTPDCKIFSIAGRQCAVAASFREATDEGKATERIAISRHNGLKPTEVAALATCNKHASGQGTCRIVARVCADASHLAAQTEREGGL